MHARVRIHTYIYIYIYICVCVCVCTQEQLSSSQSSVQSLLPLVAKKYGEDAVTYTPEGCVCICPVFADCILYSTL